MNIVNSGTKAVEWYVDLNVTGRIDLRNLRERTSNDSSFFVDIEKSFISSDYAAVKFKMSNMTTIESAFNKVVTIINDLGEITLTRLDSAPISLLDCTNTIESSIFDYLKRANTNLNLLLICVNKCYNRKNYSSPYILMCEEHQIELMQKKKLLMQLRCNFEK